MVVGIGTDIASVARFNTWQQKSRAQLNKIFSDQELATCTTSNGKLQPEKLAARFAGKEAFFKALSAACTTLQQTDTTFSLLFICKHATITQSPWGVPLLTVDWQAIENKLGPLPPLDVTLSLSHEHEYALAFVVICKRL
ncbi:MAG: holo-ACP synthase [Epsilonproteobacteria bacterium]|nr:holo-ACP synthase [Campylobacterota bacterium]